MNLRIQQIFRLARQTLGDKAGDRWSDGDLLDLLDMGHKDYAHHANLLRGECVIPLAEGVSTYKLPEDVFVILRAEYGDSKLTITSYDAMDEMEHDSHTRNYRNGARLTSDFSLASKNWQLATGPIPSAIVCDESNLNKIRVYPIPTDSQDQNFYTFANESNVQLPFAGAELFGLVTAIDNYTFDTEYGVVTDLYSPFVEHETFTSVYGVVTNIGESTGTLSLRYIKTPDTLATVNSELLTPRAFDIGLKYFIVGQALRNDLDQKNVERGNQELEFYQRELNKAIDIVSTNAVQHSDLYTTYRSAF